MQLLAPAWRAVVGHCFAYFWVKPFLGLDHGDLGVGTVARHGLWYTLKVSRFLQMSTLSYKSIKCRRRVPAARHSTTRPGHPTAAKRDRAMQDKVLVAQGGGRAHHRSRHEHREERSMTTQQARCAPDRPRTTDRCRTMGASLMHWRRPVCTLGGVPHAA